VYQTGQGDPTYNYLKNVVGGKVTKKRYLDFDWPDGVPQGVPENELIPEDVLSILEQD
jgi:hypothetical protein